MGRPMTSATEEPKSRPWQLYIVVLAVSAIAAHLVLRFAVGAEAYQDWPLFVALAAGGVPLIWQLLSQVVQLQFGADFLAAIAIVTATVLGEYLAGALVVLMLSGGETLEGYASARASRVLEALARRMPQIAHRREQGTLTDVTLDEVAPGDTLVIFPHETAPADGTVLEGYGTMDEAYLTGEPYEVDKAPGSSVLSGAVNGDAALVVRVERPPKDSRYARIMRVMEESQQSSPRIRRLADGLGAFYTPLAVSLGLAAWAISGEAVRFLAVVVVATPCPLLIGIPVALIGSISMAASRGIVIRDPAVLEQIDRCRTLLIDKTGTLTFGQPTLTELETDPDFDADEVLQLVASVERYSKHPLGQALVEAGRRRGLGFRAVTRVEEPPSQGLTATVEGREVRVTSRKQLLQEDHPDFDRVPPTQAGLECVILIDGSYAATGRFHDEPREEGRAFIEHLLPRHDFERIVLVSGDRREEVEYLAGRVGIDEVYAEQSPEQKVEITRRETERAPTVFLGDGINDAPAMASATVGIAFGQVTEVTAEAAGAVILEPTLYKVDELLHTGRRFRRIALQSAVGGMALSVVGMGFAAWGLLVPVAGAILQEGIDLVSIFNSLRTAIEPETLADVDAP